MEHNLDGLTEEQVRTVEEIVRETGYFPAMLVAENAGRGIGNARHHIIPFMYGGINADLNLIALCNLCHEDIHDWLKLRAENRRKRASRVQC